MEKVMDEVRMDKKETYELLCRQIESLVQGETDEVSVMANVAAALKEAFPERFFWVGFYRSFTPGSYIPSEERSPVVFPKGDGNGQSSNNELQAEKFSTDGETVLRLGPFQGPVACYSIPYGRGVCGSAWKERRTLVVPDVEQFAGHIACSSLSQSEIVVPVFDGTGEVRAVLDIDSRDLDAFDETDRKWLERIVKIVADEIYF